MSSPVANHRPPAPFTLPDLGGPAPASQPSAAEVARTGFVPLFAAKEIANPLEAAQEQARELLEQAQAQAQALLEKAREQGYQEGYAAGEEEGRAAARARIEAAVDNLGRIVKILDSVRAGILAVMEEEIVGLVQAACDRVLMSATAADPGLVRRVVREAIARLNQAERLTVRVNPEDLKQVQEQRPELLKEFGELKQLEVKADPEVAPGGCLVDSANAQVDASLATRRQQVLTCLTEAFHRAGGLAMDELLEQALSAPPVVDPLSETPVPSSSSSDLDELPDLEVDRPALEEW
ncbi:MAG: hypothetical protein LDL11_04165 [Desulfarculus sp.]|nr:hypothetical protein [Desulfarculus sp.]